MSIMLKQFFLFLAGVYDDRWIIWQMMKRDFKARYLGSYLGLIWAFINPLITILIFWFVFQVGFKAVPVAGIPFILWLVTGIIPWFFFADALANGTNSIIEHHYLVKKVVFRTSTLPIVKILSALIIHLFFVMVIVILFALYGFYPSIYNFQALYYIFCAIFLLLGLSWITSSLIIFIRDTGPLVGMMLQFGFWLTPIFWSIDMIPRRYHLLIRLNPAYYVIEGFRETFINKVWFWEHWPRNLYFWTIAGLIFVCGALIFRKLRPHFADVL